MVLPTVASSCYVIMKIPLSENEAVRNHSYENELYLKVYFNGNKTYFQKKTSAWRLGLKQSQKETRKWPIASIHIF